MYVLVDCNNFYASAERLFDPSLIGLPIVVLSNNDGCVIARSDEAKAIGIKMGDPAFVIRDIIKKYGIRVFSSNYALYGDISERVMHNVGRWFLEAVPYSIDECFAKAEGIADIRTYAVQARASIIHNTGIPVSIGIAPTKTLAKMANKMAKKHGGTLVLDSEELIRQTASIYPVEDVWGIGRQYYMKLEKMGITTAEQLRNLPEMWFKQHMTVQGQRLYNELWGVPMSPLGEAPPPVKGVSVTRSFGNYVEDVDVLCEAVTTHATRLSEKLRKENMCCQFLEVFMYTNQHREDHPQHYPKHRHRLPVASNNTLDIVAAATKIVRMLFRAGIKYRKTGVIATSLVPETEIQTNLFVDTDDRKDRLSEVLDKVNLALGRGTVRMASEGYAKSWALKHEYLSPRYTTDWKYIKRIR